MTHDEDIDKRSESWFQDLREAILFLPDDAVAQKKLFEIFLATAYEAGRNSVLTKQIKEG